MLRNGGEISRRVVVLDVYDNNSVNKTLNDSSETATCTTTTTVGRKINEEWQSSRKINGSSSLYTSTVTTGARLSRSSNQSVGGSGETVKVNGHPVITTKNNSTPPTTDFVTVLRVDDTPGGGRVAEEKLKSDAQSFVTILQVNEMMKINEHGVATTNGTSSKQAIETVTVYRLPGERLGMALKFEGGDANTSAPVSKVLIQSIQPDSPAARAESSGGILGRLREGDNILDIDGREVTSLTRLDCVSLLRDASVCIKLKVKRETRTDCAGTREVPNRTNNEEEEERPKLPAKKKGAPPPIPPRKTACLSHSPTINNSFPKSFEMDCVSVEGVKEKIQRLECVQNSPTLSPSEKVLKRPSHPPPLPPRRPRSGSESNSTSDTDEAEKTPTFPGGSLSMRLPGWEELMQRRAERFVDSQCQLLPAQPSVYVDLFAEEEYKRGIESESDDTGSSVSTVIEKFSRGSTANSSFSEIHHGSGPQFDLKQVLSPFEQLERELDEAAQTIVDEGDANAQTARQSTTDITILPPESFQDDALNLLDSSSYYKMASSPISPPGDSGFADDLDDDDDVKSPNTHPIFPDNFRNTEQPIRNDSTDNEEFVDAPVSSGNHEVIERENEVFVDDPLDITPELPPTNQSKENISEDENEEFVDGPLDEQVPEPETLVITKKEVKAKLADLPPVVPQKREVPKPPPVPPRLSISKSPNKEDTTSISQTKNASIIPPKTPDSKERPRSAKVIPTSLLEPQVIGAIEKKQPTTLNQSSPDRSRRLKDGGRPKTPETVKLRSKSGGHSKESLVNRRPKSLILGESKSEEQLKRPRSLSLEDADATLMSRLQEISSPVPTTLAFPSKIPRPTFLTSPITSMDRGHFNFGERSVSASVSRSNSLSAIDREPTSLPSNLNSDRRVVLLSRSESLRSVEATETTLTKVIKGKDNGVQFVQKNTVSECKGSESRSVRAASSRFGYVEKTEGRRVNLTSRSSVTSTRQNSAKSENKTETKKKLVRSHSAQGELCQRNKESETTISESPKNKKKESKDQETRSKEIVKSCPEPLTKICTSTKEEEVIVTTKSKPESIMDRKCPRKELGNFGEDALGLSGIESSNFEDKDEAKSVKKMDDEKENPSGLNKNDIPSVEQNSRLLEDVREREKEATKPESHPVPTRQEAIHPINGSVTALEGNFDKDERLDCDIVINEEPITAIESVPNYHKPHAIESTLEVINPAFQEHFGDSWLGNTFQLARQAEDQGEILILGPANNSNSPPGSFSLLDHVLKTEEESLRFRVEVGLPENGGGNEIIELQPGKNLGFFQRSDGDPFAGDNGCKNAYAWNLSRWPLQDVPEEDETLDEDLTGDLLNPNKENLKIGERPKAEEIKDKIVDSEETVEAEELIDEITLSRESVIDELTSEILERPVAEGESPVSSEKPSLVDDSVEQSQDLNSEKESEEATRKIRDSDHEGEGSKEQRPLGDEMDIYFSGPASYRVNQREITSSRAVIESSKGSPPPPPTYSRAPPDGHEFPPNYVEPEAPPPPPSSLPPKMPVNGDILSFGEKATLVRESSSTSLSRSFSLSGPPEYVSSNREGGKSYKETVAFHNQKNQASSAVPGRMTNGVANSRWNSEECLSKRATKNGSAAGRIYSRRENEKPPSIRDRIALFSQPEVPSKTNSNSQSTTVYTTTTKSINISAPPTRANSTIIPEDDLIPVTNLTNGNFSNEDSNIKTSVIMEPLVIKTTKKEESLTSNKYGSREVSPVLPTRRESSPYISNYPQTQLSRVRYSYANSKSDEVNRRSSLGSFPPPYLESRRQSATKLKGLVIPDKANFVPTTENRLPTVIRSSTVSNAFQAKSDSVVVETAKPSMAVSLDSKYPRVAKLQKEQQVHQPAFKSHSLDLPPKTPSSVATTVSSSSLTSLNSSGQTNSTKQSTFQFSLSHSKPVTPTLPEKPILVSPTPPTPVNETVEKSTKTLATEVTAPPPLPATRPPISTLTSVEPNQNSLSNHEPETRYYAYKQSATNDPVKPNASSNTNGTSKRSALDRLDSLVLTNCNTNQTNDESAGNDKLENRVDAVNNNPANSVTNKNVNLNNNINSRHQNNTYVEQVITREDIMAIASNGGAVTPDFMSCGSSVFSSSSTNDSRLWSSIRPSESDDDTNSIISLRTEDSRQTADDSLSDATTDSLDRLNSDLKPRRLSQQKTVLRARVDSADSVKNFRALAERWEMRAGDTTQDSSARSTPSGPPPPAVSSLPLTRRESGRPVTSSIAECNVKLPPSLLPRNGPEIVAECKEKPPSPTGRMSRETRSFSVTNDTWTSSSLKDRVESSLNDNKMNRKSATLERSVSTFALDNSGDFSSLDTTNNKVNRAVSYAGIGKSSRSISVSDIRKTFESQLKSESTTPPKISEPDIPERSVAVKRESSSSYSPSPTGNGKEIRSSSNLFPASTEIHHKRFSSMDSTASDSGLSTPAHYGSTSSLAAPSSGSREHFGSVTSLASTSSLISPQELQQLIDEANQSLNEELSSSGGSAGHDISVVVLHKDNLTGSIGITLAGGADYETKEITIHKIITGSLADRDDRLRKGDRIVSINGKNLRGVTHREALEILKSPRQEVVLVISRERTVSGSPASNLSSSVESVRHQTNETSSTRTERAVSLPAQPRLTILSSVTETKVTSSTRANGTTETSQRESTTTSTSNGNHVIIQLLKDGTGLGFSLEGGKDSPFGDKPLIVKRVFKGGAADREGTLKGTDEIVSVNHQSVSNMTRTEAWNFMKKLPDGPVSIIVRKS